MTLVLPNSLTSACSETRLSVVSGPVDASEDEALEIGWPVHDR
jgi:hypothetical protein